MKLRRLVQCSLQATAGVATPTTRTTKTQPRRKTSVAFPSFVKVRAELEFCFFFWMRQTWVRAVVGLQDTSANVYARINSATQEIEVERPMYVESQIVYGKGGNSSGLSFRTHEDDAEYFKVSPSGHAASAGCMCDCMFLQVFRLT